MARRKVYVSLTDSEVAALLYYVEEGLLELQDGKVDPKIAHQGNELQVKLNAALNEFATPEKQAPLFVTWVQAKDLASSLQMLVDDYDWWEFDDQEQEDFQSFIDQIQEIAKRLEPKNEDKP